MQRKNSNGDWQHTSDIFKENKGSGSATITIPTDFRVSQVRFVIGVYGMCTDQVNNCMCNPDYTTTTSVEVQ